MTDKLQTKERRTPKKGTSVNNEARPHAAGPAPGTELTAKVKSVSKTDQVIALLQRADGASLDEMVTAAGWLPDTTRAALTGLKKKGHAISSEKRDGIRRYRAAKPQ
jgi:hypothetical protein